MSLVSMLGEERARLRAEGYARLGGAGAHLVLDGIAELPAAIETHFGRGDAP